MNLDQRQKLSSNIESLLIFLWGLIFLIFPLFFLTTTTDPFVLPKQILLGGVFLLSLLIWGSKMLLDRQVKFRRTPFDVPLLLLAAGLTLSSLFSLDRADSLISLIPMLFGIFSYFVVVNLGRKQNTLIFLIASLLVGAVAGGLITLLCAIKIYPLPFAQTHATTFNTFGSYLDQAIYTLILLPIAGYFAYPMLKKHSTGQAVGFGLVFVALAGVSIFLTQQLITSQKPTILPFETGFQTAFAAISQDTGRVAQGFFFGSGYGNFSTDFSRFKQASFNQNQNLWSLSFGASSSLILEILATTGLVGILALLFLFVKIISGMDKKRKNPLFLSLVVFIIISFLLPMSQVIATVFIFVLSLFALTEIEKGNESYAEIELRFVALKKGFFHFGDPSQATRHEGQMIMPSLIATIFVAIVVATGYYSVTYVLSDTEFQSSAVAASQNNGTATYQLQSNAISTFPYRNAYYRVFSQTNIALANSLLALHTQGSSPSAQAQQTAYTLIQQSINAARTATTLSPLSVTNWQNLASIYRALISIGQNADNFSILSTQQAIQLDPTNPQEYIALGGIYYQLGQYDNAIQQFQIAVNLKQDYANAYYNLGHAYEQKQDYQHALAAYQIVKQLMANDPANEKKITDEITALQTRMGQQGNSTQAAANQKIEPITGNQQPLNVAAPTPGTTANISPIPVQPPTATNSGK